MIVVGVVIVGVSSVEVGCVVVVVVDVAVGVVVVVDDVSIVAVAAVTKRGGTLDLNFRSFLNNGQLINYSSHV